MSEPTEQERTSLNAVEGDSEEYHLVFDHLLEAKLMALDPDWMKAMEHLYDKSGCARWYA